MARHGYWLRSVVDHCHLRLRGKLAPYIQRWLVRVLIQLLVSLRHLVIRRSELREAEQMGAPGAGIHRTLEQEQHPWMG